MALDEDGELAAQAIAKRLPREVRSKHDNVSYNILKNYIYEETDAEAGDIPEIIERAYQIVQQAGTGRPDEKPETGRGGGRTTGRLEKKRTRKAIDESIISAPFRFIEIGDAVLEPEFDETIDLDEPRADCYCGKITLEWIAESPLLIGAPGTARERDGAGNAPVEPLAIGGEDVIPGATLRGMIRAASEICGLARLTQFNAHHRYGVRDFDHPYYVQDTAIAKLDQVKAGFLSVRADAQGSETWRIRPAESWKHVPVASLSAIGIDVERPSGRNFKSWKEQKLADKYELAGMLRNGRIDFTITRNFQSTSSERDDGLEVSPVASGGVKGVFVFSGALPGGGNKKFEYAVFDNPSAKAFEVPADIVETFKRLYSTPNKNKTEPIGSWKDLAPVAEAAEIPVFYVGDPDRPESFFFGLTRLFKMPHRLTVGGVLRESQKAHIPHWETGKGGERPGYRPDFVEKLFGYVVEPGDFLTPEQAGFMDPASVARKSRVAFSFATLDKATPARVSDAQSVIQMGPRASFAPFYLRGNGEKDYSAGNARLAGRKAYFPRYTQPDPTAALADFAEAGRKQIAMVEAGSGGRKISQEVLSKLRFLAPAKGELLRFHSTIRFHNATRAEIGLILFALTHGGALDGPYRHMVGRAKPFGAGQMQLADLRISATPNAGGAAVKGRGSESIAPFLDAFSKHARNAAPRFPEVAAVQEWLGMADPANGAAAAREGRLDYQPLGSFKKMRDQVKPLIPPCDPPLARDRLLAAPKPSGK